MNWADSDFLCKLNTPTHHPDCTTPPTYGTHPTVLPAVYFSCPRNTLQAITVWVVSWCSSKIVSPKEFWKAENKMSLIYHLTYVFKLIYTTISDGFRKYSFKEELLNGLECLNAQVQNLGVWQWKKTHYLWLHFLIHDDKSGQKWGCVFWSGSVSLSMVVLYLFCGSSLCGCLVNLPTIMFFRGYCEGPWACTFSNPSMMHLLPLIGGTCAMFSTAVALPVETMSVQSMCMI